MGPRTSLATVALTYGWTYRIEAEADDVVDAELILVAMSILDACDAEVGGV